MKPSHIIALVQIVLTLTFSITAFANMMATPPIPISHCYHWLEERSRGYLTYKYNYANQNKGELTFYTTPSTSKGAAAGAGLYCAKTPIESYSYGDRVIRVEFVDDVVINSGNKNFCGKNGKFYATQAECDSKSADVILFNRNPDWYVIKNPQAVKAWTSNDDILINDLKAIKADGDSRANAHIDQTLQVIASESSSLKKTYNNLNARMSLVEVLKDPKKLAQIPPLSLIAMLASHKGPDISDSVKNTHYVNSIDRALADSLLTYADFEATLKIVPAISDLLINHLKKINFSKLNTYNSSTLITAFDKNDIPIKPENVTLLWNAALSSQSSLEAILAGNLKKDGQFRKRFNSILPPPQKLMTQVTANNYGAMIKILNELADEKGKNLKAYTSFLFEGLIKSNHAAEIIDIYKKITNPSLFKEQAIADLFKSGMNTKFAGYDPIVFGLILDGASTGINPQDLDKYQKAILELPLKVSNQLTYLFLEDFKADKIKLPSFFDEKTFLIKLVERSINETMLAKYSQNSTTNTYRMILSGYYLYFNKRTPKKNMTPVQANDFFLDLASWLYKKNYFNYAYVALQNAAVFDSGNKFGEHVADYLLGKHGTGQAALDQLIDQVLGKSLDSGTLLYLIHTARNTQHPKSNLAKKIAKDMLNYFISNEFRNQVGKAEFNLENEEKRIWPNFVNKKYASEGRLAADICSFTKVLENLKPVIDSDFSDVATLVHILKSQIYADQCQ